MPSLAAAKQTEDAAPRATLAEWRERVRGKNISPETLLATDYLNHFNEVTMLIELLPDSPDMLEMCLEWRPCGYRRHFENGAIADRDLIIEAYDHVPKSHRAFFEATITELDATVLGCLDAIKGAIESEEASEVAGLCHEAVTSINALVHRLNAIIHGKSTAMNQDEIDSLLNM